MKKIITYNLSVFLLAILSFVLIQCNNAGENKQTNSDSTGSIAATEAMSLPDSATYTLPFKLEFIEKKYNGTGPLPRLQSYSVAVTKDGSWIISGGRRQGLHTFKSAPANNFIPDSANNFIYLINPTNGIVKSFDVNLLSSNLSAPLQSTNQQFFYDAETDQMYIIGGYGWNADKTNMVTFNTIIRYNASAMVTALSTSPTPQKITSLLEISQDDCFAVTGGELFKMDSKFFLVFGQQFNGQYRAFGGNKKDFTQKYTEEVRVFTLVPNTLKVLRCSPTTNTEADQPFHRRDGNIIADIDPATSKPRITAFGGVFLPGIIGAYTFPVFINGAGSPPVVDRSINQKFSQYECPVISIFDSSSNFRNVYHTFFAGISHYYYHQTPSQKDTFNYATKQGRNDGFPFVADISTLMLKSDGSFNEFIHPKPTPGNRLIGSSVPFIFNRELIKAGYAYENEVIKLAKFAAGTRTLAGYIYGGIEANNPFPAIANFGTTVSNSVFEVWVTATPSQVIDASAGHESRKADENLKRE